MTAPVGILGGGRFGRALAAATARGGSSVRLWSRTARTFDDDRILVSNDPACLVPCELVFVCVPSPHVARVASLAAGHLDGRHMVVHVSRGLVGPSLATVGETFVERTAVRRVGALAGPLSARALEAGDPSGGVVGTRFSEITTIVRRALSGARCRIYGTDDCVGVELASALTGLVALCVGLGAGLGLGASMRAVLAARGMVEAARVVRARGGRLTTLQGIAGWGDLASLLVDPSRPEIAYGVALGRGEVTIDEVSHDEVFIEGRSLCRQVLAFARGHGLDVPLLEALGAVLAGDVTGEAAMGSLLARPVGSEGLDALDG